MKLLIKTALLLALLFASTFLVIKLTGVLSVEDIRAGFESLKAQPAYFIGALVVLLLFADLFIAVPTMTVIILSGYFLGFQTAMMFSFFGLMLAAFSGYLISRIWGNLLLQKINKNEMQRLEMQTLFHEYGVLVLILSRAMPILPEVSACLAGVTKMPFKKFLLGWGLGSIPYLSIVTYAGSISSFDNPFPAIVTAIAITSSLWLVWFFFMYRTRKRTR